MAGELSEIPASFKSILAYLKIANQHEQRDIIITYWARLYALQSALKMSKKKSQEENNFLIKLMTWLEETKKANQDNEAITNDIAAQAHIENYALKLFLYADENDRAANFTKSVIQSFFTAGLLYDILSTFGELSEEASQNRKYAQWKATYINNCLKNGETPVPGPLQDSPLLDDDIKGKTKENPDETSDEAGPDVVSSPDDDIPEPADDLTLSEDEKDKGQTTPPPKTINFGFPPVPNNSSLSPPSTPQIPSSFESQSQIGGDGLNLTTDQMLKAQKYIKWAGSALNYEDISTAVGNLQKALCLLTTGQDG